MIWAGAIAWVVRFPNGMIDWGDTHFITYLLEHWYDSFTSFQNPLQTNFFWPYPHSLGMSTSMAMFSPYYTVFRLLSLDPLVSYNLTIVTVSFTGFIACYYLVHAILDSRSVALLLAVLYIMSPVFWGGLGFVWSQVLHAHFAPLLFLILVRGLQSSKSGPRLIYISLFGLGLSLLLFSESYMGIFLHLFIGLTVLFVQQFFVLFYMIGQLWGRELVTITKDDLQRLLTDGGSGLIGWAIGFALFVKVYAPNAERGLELFTEPVYEPISRILLDLSYSGFFFLLAALTLIVWASWSIVKGRTVHIWALILFLSGLGAILVSQWFRWDFTINPWRGLAALLPPLGSVRDVSRIGFLLPTFAVIVITIGIYATDFLQSIQKGGLTTRKYAQYAPHALLIVLGIYSLAFQQFRKSPIITSHIPWNRTPDLFNHYHQVSDDVSDAMQTHCDAFAVYYEDSESAEHMIGLYGHQHMMTAIGAMFIATQTGVPTVNGYSAFGPDKWGLPDPSSDAYLGNLTYWLSVNEITAGPTRICLYDLYTHKLINYADLTVLAESDVRRE